MRWDDGVFLMAQLCSFCGFQPKRVTSDTDRDCLSVLSPMKTQQQRFLSPKNIGTRPSIQT
jgi:hypothetical protein